LSTINTGDSNPASIASIIKRTGQLETQIRKELSLKTQGKNNGFYGRKHRPEVLKHLASIRSEQAKKVSAPELILWGMLHALKIPFEYQVAIDKYIVDFKIGNVVLEVYGDYWHGSKMSPSNKRRDKSKENYIRPLYHLQIIKESELVNNPGGIVNKLCELKV
jgi:very-short-patch-repair endonuclease